MTYMQQLIALQTIVVKEIRRFLRIWPQTILPPAITMSLYFIIFGKMIGSRIGTVDGYSYMQFIVPGLVMMAVITNSYSNVVSSFYSAKFQRSIEELIVSPVPYHIVISGYMLGGMARGLAVGFVVTLLSLFFTSVHIYNIGIVVLTVVLTSALFSLAGLINAIYANSFDDISIIPTFVLTPLTYLGGVFYAINQLPPFWQHVSLLNPIVYMVNAFRFGILGHSDVNVGLSLSIIAITTVTLYGFAYYLISHGKGMRE